MTAAAWITARTWDFVQWPLNLIRDTPGRVRRLSQAITAPGLSPGARLHRLTCASFDLVGGPEITQFLMHLGLHTTPLTGPEITAIAAVLGPRAVRYGDICLATGGFLPFVFRLNGGRAFATWHTIHLPATGRHTRADLSLLVHEVTHVYQYECVGSRYIGEALHAQRRLGPDAYRYGGPAGLQTALANQKRLAQFNREAQAQIAQDYYRRQLQEADVSAYTPFIAALRSGAF